VKSIIANNPVIVNFFIAFGFDYAYIILVILMEAV